MGRVGSVEEIENVKEDLLKLDKWSEMWQMQFNVDKCKVMHLGNSNLQTKYQLGGKDLSTTKEEKDLGVIFDDRFKVGKQCLKAAKNGNKTLGMIKRTFACRNKNIMINNNNNNNPQFILTCAITQKRHNQLITEAQGKKISGSTVHEKQSKTIQFLTLT